MKKRYFIFGGSVLTFVIAALFHLTAQFNHKISMVTDPAFAFYSNGKNAGYADIDSWAHYGMRIERFVEVLHDAGFSCAIPPVLQTPSDVVTTVDMLCQKTEQLPFGRNLAIHAQIEHGIVNRLVGASADSVLIPAHQSYTAFLANLLRKAGWMEPEKLQAVGFRLNSLDTLSLMIADALSMNGWYARCQEINDQTLCPKLARERARQGFPQMPVAQVQTSSVFVVRRLLERINFMPVKQRNADSYPADSLLVRLANGKMWLDFVSKDMVGHKLTLAIELESMGGTPTNMVLALDGISKTMPLAGLANRANDNAMIYLLPEAGASEIRYAVWLNLPNKNYPGTFDRIANTLPRIDPSYIEPMFKAIISDFTATASAEESLGLYPVLWQIEQRAAVFRRLQPDRWMLPDQSNHFIAQSYPNDLVTRTAWAFASCETSGNSVIIDHDCARRFVTADPDAAAMVRSEITKQQLLFGALPDSHPLRIRLNALSDAYRPQIGTL